MSGDTTRGTSNEEFAPVCALAIASTDLIAGTSRFSHLFFATPRLLRSSPPHAADVAVTLAELCTDAIDENNAIRPSVNVG